MKASVEKYIPIAYATLLDNQDTLKDVHKSYISAIGAGLRQSGLLPTIAFYSNENSDADRKTVIKWILTIIKANNQSVANPTLLQYALSLDLNGKRKLESDIMDISIALKLCIRTFNLKSTQDV